MSDGRTVWLPKDAAWWRREYVVALGEEFGADGPAVLDWLACEAKAQNDGGRVKTGIRSCARGCFVDAVTVGHVLSRAVALGALDDFEESDGRFVARISGWKADNERGTAAARKAAQRAKSAASHDESRPVTECPPIGQDRRDREADASPEVVRLSHLLADLIRERDPKASVRPDSASWLRATRLLLADRRGDAAEVERVIRWCQADSFWQNNILSPKKLREKFTQLALKANASNVHRLPRPQLEHTGDFDRFDGLEAS